jgi:hypothetical protein
MKRTKESPEVRIARLERVVGSLLTLLAAQEVIGPEDFGKVREELASRTDGEKGNALSVVPRTQALP